MIARFWAAVSFLTRAPVPARTFEARDMGRAALFFPLVGAGIGLVQYLALGVLYPRLPSLVSSTLVVALSAWMTRALHLDGLVDFADGLGGGSSPEESLAIMRDPRAGSFGVVAVVLVLAVKITAIGSIAPAGAPAPLMLVVAPALARWTIVPLGSFCRYARPEGGLATALTEHVRKVDLAGATAISALLVGWLAPERGLPAFVAVAVTTAVVAAVARGRLGGVTGDVLGANVELAEAAALVVGAAAVS